MNKFFSEVKKTFGFGCMRLPMKNDEVDYEEFSLMIDEFIENGFNYFDTAHGYINGKSEIAIKNCLSNRYSRDKFLLTNKLTDNFFNTNEDIRIVFNEQLNACGVNYFDFYLMHAQNARNFVKFKNCKAYETAIELKKEGKIKHLGISFHDSAEVLENILKEYPEIEVVQIQLNYLDYYDIKIQSKLCYDVCLKYNKPVIVMEPVKGGNLINLPKKAEELLLSRNNGSVASYAIRFAAGFEQVMMTLSGMSNLEQLKDNISYMKNFKALDNKELEVIDQVVELIKEQNMIPCTNCKYCVSGCPKEIMIPDILSDLNLKILNDFSSKEKYLMHIKNKGKASDCISCGKCEKICPQKLEIRKYLNNAVYYFEK